MSWEVRRLAWIEGSVVRREWEPKDSLGPARGRQGRRHGHRCRVTSGSDGGCWPSPGSTRHRAAPPRVFRRPSTEYATAFASEAVVAQRRQTPSSQLRQSLRSSHTLRGSPIRSGSPDRRRAAQGAIAAGRWAWSAVRTCAAASCRVRGTRCKASLVSPSPGGPLPHPSRGERVPHRADRPCVRGPHPPPSPGVVGGLDQPVGGALAWSGTGDWAAAVAREVSRLGVGGRARKGVPRPGERWGGLGDAGGRRPEPIAGTRCRPDGRHHAVGDVRSRCVVGSSLRDADPRW
jgi:hypothetical protein